MKQLLRLMLLVTVVSVLVACTAAPAPEATGNVDTAPAADGVDRSKLAKELYFYNWTDYVDPQILADFEAEYGVKVILDTYDANEDMIAKVAAGGSGYDIAVPSICSLRQSIC